MDVDQNVTVNQNVKVSVKDEIKKEKPPDTYTELNKLDDLRKRGLSSEAEFETEKRKLLQPK